MKKAKFSPQEKKKLEIIKEVKEFERQFGFEPTENFNEYKEGDPRCNTGYLHKKKDLPFSYIDPKMRSFETTDGDLKTITSYFAKEGLDPQKYDFYFYVALGYAEGSFITRNLLRSSKKDIVNTIFHEDFHDNVCLPRHMNEAGACIAGEVGWCLFAGFSKRKTSSFLKKVIKNIANPHNKCFNELSEKHELFKSEVLSFEDYQKEKTRIIKKYGFVDLAYVCSVHSYYYYFPLLVRLIRRLDYDLGKFLEIMKDCPFGEPDLQKCGNLGYFQETRRREKKMEIYLNDIISKK